MTNTFSERLLLAAQGQPYGYQTALARACGIRPSSVNDWMSGKTKMVTADLLFPAARFLNVNPEWLATGRGAMHDGCDGSVKPPPAPSQPVGLDASKLSQAMLFARTFLQESGEAPDLPRHAELVAMAYEALMEPSKGDADQVAFMGRMMAKLLGRSASATERQTGNGGSQGVG